MYSDLIVENFSNPTYVGDLERYQHQIEVGNPVCGDRIRVQVWMDGAVKDVAFRAWGCATSVAAANIFCASIINQDLALIAARTNADVAAMLGELAPEQRHCIDIMQELHRKLVSKLSPGGDEQ